MFSHSSKISDESHETKTRNSKRKEKERRGKKKGNEDGNELNDKRHQPNPTDLPASVSET